MYELNAAPDSARRLQDAVSLVRATPGYDTIGDDLARLLTQGKLQFMPTLEDRGQATLGGRLLVGPEAVFSSPVSLAETLVHEHWHLRRQPPLEKTASFWLGVATGKPVMRRYEMPAYRSALHFLVAVESAFPQFADEARAEQEMVRASFAEFYGGPLTE
ncbi:MAG: hypothetical protein V4671_05175 [Armatimonadota bacterium]